MKPRPRAFFVLPFLLLVSATLSAAAETVKISVDYGSAPAHIAHATLRIPATRGTLTLRYPKWLPGEHGPTGPIKDMAGLIVRANGRDIGWKRQPKDMFAFDVDVPDGVSEIEVALDLLISQDTEGFSSAASASAKLAVLSWNQILVYPDGVKGNEINYEATLTIPAGWTFATALPVQSSETREIRFQPVSLTTLIDSPVLMGEYMRSILLDERPGQRVFLDLAADAKADLEIPADLEAGYKKLVREADALFGARHFREYHFLMSLSDKIAHFGLEHHASSDDRVRERALVDPDRRKLTMNILPHEFVHSWNGKYRRPADLNPDDFASPIDSNLLWVYEGLTQYLGWVLAARSGTRTVPEALDHLALRTAELEHRGGRVWRSLEDTAVAAQLLFATEEPWTSYRRTTDFYDEGVLIWLDADVTIRKLTKGTRSLDDFCRRFHGGGNGAPEVKTYRLYDIVSDLNFVVPHDWGKFFNDRIQRRGGGAPMAGIQDGGWRLTMADTRSPVLQSYEEVNEVVDVSYSLGLLIDKNAAVVDVLPDSKAWAAGITPGMKLVAVNGRKYSKETLRDAIRATKSGAADLKLLIENDEYFQEIPVRVDGGERYPALTRSFGDDVLGAILAPKSDSSYKNAADPKKR